MVIQRGGSRVTTQGNARGTHPAPGFLPATTRGSGEALLVGVVERAASAGAPPGLQLPQVTVRFYEFGV